MSTLVRRSPTSPQPLSGESFFVDITDSPPAKPQGLMSRISGYTRFKKQSESEPLSGKSPGMCSYVLGRFFCNFKCILLAVCVTLAIVFLVRYFHKEANDPMFAEGNWTDVSGNLSASFWRMVAKAMGKATEPDHEPAILAPSPPLSPGFKGSADAQL